MIITIWKWQTYIPLSSWISLTRPREVRKLLRFLNLSSKDHVLDVACGNGYWTRQFARKGGCRIQGCDLDDRSIAFARRFWSGRGRGIRYTVSPAEKLPFETGEFDKVVSICALEHFNDDLAALQEMGRVMRAGGTLAISVDSFTAPGVDSHYRHSHAQQHHVQNYYTSALLQDRLRAAGFEVVRTEWIGNSPAFWPIYHFAQRAKPCALIVAWLTPVLALVDRFSRNFDTGIILVAEARKAEMPGAACGADAGQHARTEA